GLHKTRSAAPQSAGRGSPGAPCAHHSLAECGGCNRRSASPPASSDDRGLVSRDTPGVHPTRCPYCSLLVRPHERRPALCVRMSDADWCWYALSHTDRETPMSRRLSRGNTSPSTAVSGFYSLWIKMQAVLRDMTVRKEDIPSIVLPPVFLYT